MPYITVMQTPRTHQITLEEILKGEVNVDATFSPTRDTSGTVTRFMRTINDEIILRSNIPSMILALEKFIKEHDSLYAVNRPSLYKTFPISKKSGGLRWINAPHESLMEAQRELKSIFEDKMFALYHTSAFAYVKNRNTYDALKRHQANESKWFEKTDFSDFFGSTTAEFVLGMMSIIFPFSEIMKDEKGKQVLTQALDLCFLNGGLPQGTPISPMLTNFMMIPIDHTLSQELRKKGFIYTRYADDIQISSRYEFNPFEMVKEIDSVLTKFNAPFKIKPSKTRYGSSSGRNWNLGLMLNRNNQITVGYQAKKRFKAMCSNYIQDRTHGVRWDLHDVNALNGLKSYYKMVEKDTISHIIDQLNKKYEVNLARMIRSDLRGDP